MSKSRHETQTGVATLHDLLGGALPGRIHLITGGPGSGKTSVCLHFLREGMVRAERTALVTLDRPRDLQSHAGAIGHDIRASVRDGRLTILRYDARFAPRLAATASAGTIVNELHQALTLADLRQMAPAQTPLRIAIDPISPFLSEGITTGAALSALVDALEETNATVMMTWTGDVSASTDRRVERLIERAAVILKLDRVAGAVGHVPRRRRPRATRHREYSHVRIRDPSGVGALAGCRQRLPISDSI